MKIHRLLVKVMRDSNFAFGWKYMVLESKAGLVSPTWMYAVDPKKYDLVENEYYELEVDIKNERSPPTILRLSKAKDY